MAAVTHQVHSVNFNEEFLKGKPTALGVLSIILAIMQIILESVLIGIQVFGLNSYISYWGSVIYIIAGSLAIAASNKQDIGLVKAAMALNIITAIVSSIALILSIVNIALISLLLQRVCDTENDVCWRVIAGIIIFIIIMLSNVLLISMSITIAYFASRASSQAATQSSNQVFIIQNQTMVPVAQGPGTVYYSSHAQPPPPAGYPVDYQPQKPAM